MALSEHESPHGISTESPLRGEIDAKLASLGRTYRLNSPDGRITRAILLTPIRPMIDRGLLTYLNGDVPLNPSENAQVTLVRANDEASVGASLAISPSEGGGEPSVWTVSFDKNEKPKLLFSVGKKKKRLPYTTDAAVTFRRIVDHANPERNIDYYLHTLRSWQKRAKWSGKDVTESESALMMAELHHKGVVRKSGEPYLEHAWQTARQLWEWGIRDASPIKAALGHDVPEDSKKLRPHPGEFYEDWYNRIYKQMREAVGAEAARLIMLMSKPPMGTIDSEGKGMTRAKRLDIYYENIASEPRLILIKLADRLHNIRTLWAMDDANIEETIYETRTVYLPMLDNLPPHMNKLVAKIIADFEKEFAKYDL